MASLLEFGAQLASVYRKKSPMRDPGAQPLQPPKHATIMHDGASLSKLVEREIIPRLVASYPVTSKLVTLGDSDQITAEEVDGFAPLSLHVEADALLEYVEAILRRGVGIDSILVDLLAPAARRRGGSANIGKMIAAISLMSRWACGGFRKSSMNLVPGCRSNAKQGQAVGLCSLPWLGISTASARS